MLRLCMSGAGVAFPVQLISSPRHSVSILCYSSALHCTSSPQLCPASPLLCNPCPCLSVLIRRVAVPGQAWRFPCKSWHIHALAAQGFAFPARCGYKHCFALPRFALTKRTVPKPCTALPTRGGTSQIVAVPALIRSAPPALIRSDHCLRRSVLGEELSDPALCIEGQALCPGCRLAHNGSDALEISFRVFGAVFHHHFIVNMEDYLVPSRFQVV